jgi:hypothetical protein
MPEQVGNYMLRGLDELNLPEQISYLPIAPGWRIMLGVLLILLIYRVYKLGCRYWNNRYRRSALQWLDTTLRKKGPQAVLCSLPAILKATALQTYPRDLVAPLSGEAWLQFLDAHYEGPSFATDGRALATLAYVAADDFKLNDLQTDLLINMSRMWIKQHKAHSDV